MHALQVVQLSRRLVATLPEVWQVAASGQALASGSATINLLAPLAGSGGATSSGVAAVALLMPVAGAGSLLNLLSADMASFEGGIADYTGVGCTLAQSTAQALDGTHSLAITVS